MSSRGPRMSYQLLSNVLDRLVEGQTYTIRYKFSNRDQDYSEADVIFRGHRPGNREMGRVVSFDFEVNPGPAVDMGMGYRAQTSDIKRFGSKEDVYVLLPNPQNTGKFGSPQRTTLYGGRRSKTSKRKTHKRKH
jgi:hypothetical protein